MSKRLFSSSSWSAAISAHIIVEIAPCDSQRQEKFHRSLKHARSQEIFSMMYLPFFSPSPLSTIINLRLESHIPKSLCSFINSKWEAINQCQCVESSTDYPEAFKFRHGCWCSVASDVLHQYLCWHPRVIAELMWIEQCSVPGSGRISAISFQIVFHVSVKPT